MNRLPTNPDDIHGDIIPVDGFDHQDGPNCVCQPRAEKREIGTLFYHKRMGHDSVEEAANGGDNS